MNDYNKQLSHHREDSEHLSRDLRVCMVCLVEEVNGCVVNVIPAFRERIMDKQNRTVIHEPMQTIEDVPVSTIGGISFEVSEGDYGLLIYHDVSLDEFLDSESITDLEEVSRSHDYTDAIFLPFDIRCTATDDAKIKIRSDGTIESESEIRAPDFIVNGRSMIDFMAEYDSHYHLVGGLFGSSPTSGPQQ